MDDSCAVCADTLEWVAYGACGHRDVCSTCVTRLRFICEDRRCCICKTESPVVFVTKALGDYTMMINDFSLLPSEVREGKMGSYWYHEDTQAFFDDVDHYKMIKEMCRLSCSVCDKSDDEPNNVSKRRGKFKNIEQLRGHIFHQHKLIMCNLCLEARKVFICEQKLYTRSQLNQHISTGDSEVDGSENERGGFMGHPSCEFCRTPFYGDNELYMHMSTEHYKCHICQRQHPGQHDYYASYNDLENHFRRDHFLCEDEACLAKKFIVFPSEGEIKRHNTIEHGGRMSRSKRNAALQIPTSFRYHQSNEQDRRSGGRGRGRGRGLSFHHDHSDDQLSMAIQASLETAINNGTTRDPMASSSVQTVNNYIDPTEFDPLVESSESLNTLDSGQPSRYLQATEKSYRGVPLTESSFPPLPVVPSHSHGSGRGVPVNSMATHINRKNKKKATANANANLGEEWPTVNRGLVLQSSSSSQFRPTANIKPAKSQSSSSAASIPSYANPVVPQAQYQVRSTSNISHSASAPNLANNGSLPISNFPPFSVTKVQKSSPANQTLPLAITNFPPVSASKVQNQSPANQASPLAISNFPSISSTKVQKPPPPAQTSPLAISNFPSVSATKVQKSSPANQALPKVQDVQHANRSLVENIRAALEFDEDKYASFKEISGQYRRGAVDTGRYLNYVQQHGLSHLVVDLARLCPDEQKQTELVDAYHASLQNNCGIGLKGSSNPNKGKGKTLVAEVATSKNSLADTIINTARKLQLDNKYTEEEVEVLSKDGYRTAKGKSKVIIAEHQLEPGLNGTSENYSSSVGTGSSKTGVDKSKKQKKTSKFLRVRLGDGSISAILDSKNSDPDPNPDSTDPAGMPVRGVWRKGGVNKLF